MRSALTIPGLESINSCQRDPRPRVFSASVQSESPGCTVMLRAPSACTCGTVGADARGSAAMIAGDLGGTTVGGTTVGGVGGVKRFAKGSTLRTGADFNLAAGTISLGRFGVTNGAEGCAVTLGREGTNLDCSGKTGDAKAGSLNGKWNGARSEERRV